MLNLFSFIVSLVVTMILIPPIMKWADKIGAIDLPDIRKVHTTAIPRVGGIAMLLGSFLSVVFWAEFEKDIIALLVGFGILFVFGVWDDRRDLNYKIKFIGQVLAVLVVVIYGDVVVRTIPFFDYFPDFIAIPFTVFALVGITNAINLSDGLDGLAGGTTLLSLCVIALLAFQADGLTVVVVCMAVAGSIFGFLRHNTYPARLFMGDTGSQFLGFSVGVLSVLLTQNVNTAMSPVLPLLILGLPILDTVAVMSQRIYEKRSPFSPDKNHIHHKLLAMGFDHYEAVMMIYLVQSMLVIGAYFTRYESDGLLLLSYLVFSLIVLFLFHVSNKYNWKLHRDGIEKKSTLRDGVKWLYNSGWLTTVPTSLLNIAIPVIFIISVILPANIEHDLSIISAYLLAILLISQYFSKGAVSIVEKAVIYIFCVVSVFLLQGIDVSESEYYYLINYLFIVLAIAFALKVRFSKDRTFQITPLDFLVVLLVVVVPNIPDLGLEEDHIGEMALKLIVLFYCSEAVTNIMSKRWALARIGLISALAIATIRGL
jgi:UDP-GlcNAc:undecaprenyl-phosphate/decaprenyl-phosphate GlcNAc-1-phosphate transferase